MRKSSREFRTAWGKLLFLAAFLLLARARQLVGLELSSRASKWRDSWLACVSARVGCLAFSSQVMAPKRQRAEARACLCVCVCVLVGVCCPAVPEVLAEEIQDLKRRRAQTRADNRDLAKQAKNLQKRRARLLQVRPEFICFDGKLLSCG